MPKRSKVHDPLPPSVRAQVNAAKGRKPREKDRLYDTPDWRWLRAAHIAQHPLCVECLGRGVRRPAIVVDHIKPHGGDVDLFFDIENLQSLCRPCHSRKTTLRDHRGFAGGRRTTDE